MRLSKDAEGLVTRYIGKLECRDNREGCHSLLDNIVGITLVNLIGHTIKQNIIRVEVTLFIKKT